MICLPQFLKGSKTCGAHAEDRLTFHRDCHRRMNEAELSDEEREEIVESFQPLAMEPYYTVRILLSWGGPSDGFFLTFSEKDCTVVRGEYFYEDWSTYEEVPLSKADAEMIAELFLSEDVSRFFE